MKKKRNKFFLFDFDGVVCNKPEVFSKKLSREQNIPLDQINKFFETDFSPCLIGTGDLKVVIAPYLKEWGIKSTVEDFLGYWFASENFLDNNLLEYIQELRNSGFSCHLVSNQEKHRGCYILKQMGMEDQFDSVLFSYQAGSKKPSENFWQRFFFFKTMTAIKENIILWDDDQENVNGAVDFGYTAYLYKDFDSFKTKMDKIL
jgi:FMN phosphatase YigB (HAD superfamily)